MAKIAYILLCHGNPDSLRLQIEMLVASGGFVAVHFDKSSADSSFKQLESSFANQPNVVFSKRIKCGWGAWSLVKASLSTLKLAEAAFPDASHFYLISGDCFPIKSAAFISDFLDQSGQDYIEHQDFYNSGWIKTGMIKDRLRYRHPFNERSQVRLFYGFYELQKILKWHREVPKELQMKIGSQWWCLRRSTVERLLKFVRKRRDIVRFFKTVWIPDECFFQTLVLHLVARDQVVNQPPTFLMFSDYGKPATFHNDHVDLLKRQNRLFARKISVHSPQLRESLAALFLSDERPEQAVGNGARIYEFLTNQGRHGRRFAPRFWERGRTVGKDRELLVIVSARRSAARDLVARINENHDFPAYGFVFNDTDVGLPDLGNLGSSLAKRGRHRRAFVRLMFDVAKADKMVICIDSSSKDIFEDFNNDACKLSVLFLEGAAEESYLRKYADRRGLLGDAESSEQLQILNVLGRELSDELIDFQLAHANNSSVRSYSISMNKFENRDVLKLAAFLDIPKAAAAKLVPAPATQGTK